MKLVAFDEIYNSDLDYINYLSLKMSLNEKGLNYKVIDLIESYKFHIKFISIRVHKQSYDFLKTD
jgi:hypothetical protein